MQQYTVNDLTDFCSKNKEYNYFFFRRKVISGYKIGLNFIKRGDSEKKIWFQIIPKGIRPTKKIISNIHLELVQYAFSYIKENVP